MEETVAISCECDVAPFSRHRRFRKVTNRSTQELGRIVLNNDHTEREARYLNLAQPRELVWQGLRRRNIYGGSHCRRRRSLSGLRHG